MGLNGISASESVWGNTQSDAVNSLLSQLTQNSSANSSTSLQDSMLENLFSALDSDGDGAISQTEMQETADNVQNLLSSLNSMSSQVTAYEAQKEIGRASCRERV